MIDFRSTTTYENCYVDDDRYETLDDLRDRIFRLRDDWDTDRDEEYVRLCMDFRNRDAIVTGLLWACQMMDEQGLELVRESR